MNKSKILRSRSSLFQFLFDIHNIWSMNMGKPQMSWQEAVTLYRAADVIQEPVSELHGRQDVVEHMITMTNVSTLYAHSQWAKKHEICMMLSLKQQRLSQASHNHDEPRTPISASSTDPWGTSGSSTSSKSSSGWRHSVV